MGVHLMGVHHIIRRRIFLEVYSTTFAKCPRGRSKEGGA